MSNDFDKLEGSGVEPCTGTTTYKYQSIQELQAIRAEVERLDLRRKTREELIAAKHGHQFHPQGQCDCGMYQQDYFYKQRDENEPICINYLPPTGDYVRPGRRCPALKMTKPAEYTLNTKTEHGVTTESFELTKLPQKPVDLIFTRQDDHTLSPVATMSQLRISYESVKSIKGSRSKQIAFTGCTNLPEKLPPYLEVVQPELKPTKVRTQLSEITKLLGNASRLTISTDKHGNVTTEVENLCSLTRKTVYTAWQLQNWDIELMTVLEGMSKR